MSSPYQVVTVPGGPGRSKASHSAEERTVLPYQYKVVVVGDLVARISISANSAEVTRCEVLHATLYMKEVFALKGDRAKIVKEIQLRGGISFEIVAHSRRKLGNCAFCRSGSAVCRAGKINAGADDSHVDHWPKVQLLVS